MDFDTTGSTSVKKTQPLASGSLRRDYARSPSASSASSDDTLVGEAEQEVEGTIDASAKQGFPVGLVSQALTRSRTQTTSSCDITLDIVHYENLQTHLESASVKCQQWREGVYNSWTKRLILSTEQRLALEKEVDVATQLINDIQEACSDTKAILDEVERVKRKYLPLPPSDNSYSQETAALSENSVSILVEQCEIYIAEHVQKLECVEQDLMLYLNQTQRFLALPENTPPKQDAIDRASVLLATLPSLIGGVVTALFYALGATAALSMVPLGVGLASTCVTAVMFARGVAQFFPAEKVRQITDERKALTESAFPPVLNSLKKAIDMFGRTPPASVVNSGVDARTFTQASDTIDKRLGETQNAVQELSSKLDRFVDLASPVLQGYSRPRTLSNDSGLGRSRPDTPLGAGKASEFSTLPMEKLKERFSAEVVAFQAVLEEISVLDEAQREQIKLHLTSTREADYLTALKNFIRAFKDEDKLNAEQGLQILLELPSKGLSYWNTLQELKNRFIKSELYSSEQINAKINKQINKAKKSPEVSNMV